MANRSWRLILNGRESQREDIREAVGAHRSVAGEVEVRVTWEGGDAGRYVREAADDGIDTIIAGGGDGTVNEVCGALADIPGDAGTRPAVAVLPLGTANDFATGAGIPDDPLGAFDLIASTEARPVDLLRILPSGGDARWCVNLATGGFGTKITTETNPKLKKLLGGAAYLLTGLTRFDSVKSSFGRFVAPGFEWDGEFLVVGLGNGRQAGGGHRLCPAALVDDGLMDVMILPSPEGDIGSTLGSLLMNGRTALMETAVIARVPWLEISETDGLTLNLDGEPVETERYRVEVAPGWVRMHLPADSPYLTRR